MIKDFVKGGCTFALKDLMEATLDVGTCVNYDMRELALDVAMACLEQSSVREQAVTTVLFRAMLKTLDTPNEADDGKYKLQLFAKDVYNLLQEYGWPTLRPDVKDILRLYEHNMGVCLLGGDEQSDMPRSKMLAAFTNFTLCRKLGWLFAKYDQLRDAKNKLLESYATENKTQVLAACATLICTASEICGLDDADAEAAHDLLFTCLDLLELLNKRY